MGYVKGVCTSTLVHASCMGMKQKALMGSYPSPQNSSPKGIEYIHRYTYHILYIMYHMYNISRYTYIYIYNLYYIIYPA